MANNLKLIISLLNRIVNHNITTYKYDVIEYNRIILLSFLLLCCLFFENKSYMIPIHCHYATFLQNHVESKTTMMLHQRNYAIPEKCAGYSK